MSPSRRALLRSAALLVCCLGLMYSSTFAHDYLMNDERGFIGQPMRVLPLAREHFLGYARPLSGVFHALTYNFVGLSPFRVRVVRFANFAALAAIAVWLFSAAFRRRGSWPPAFFGVLLLFSQPAFQGLMGYSLELFSTAIPGLWLSLLAFQVHFSSRPRDKWLRGAAAFALLLLSLNAAQTYAYFAMVPLTLVALTEDGEGRSKVWSFLALAGASLVVGVIELKVALYLSHRAGASAYYLAEGVATDLEHHPLRLIGHALRPWTYWSALGVWPSALALAQRRVAALVLMSLWLLLLASALVSELARGSNRRAVYAKWGAALLCLAFAAMPMAASWREADVEHRPHLTVVFAGVVIFWGMYALQVLGASRSPRLRAAVGYACAALVVLAAFGARQVVARTLVQLRADQLDFLRAELMSKSPAQYRKVIVIHPAIDQECFAAPCSAWFGRLWQPEEHEKQPNGYRYALATLGIDPDSKEVTFTQRAPAEIAADEVVVDWRKWAAAKRRDRGAHAR